MVSLCLKLWDINTVLGSCCHWALPTPIAGAAAQTPCAAEMISWEMFAYFTSCFALKSVVHFSQNFSKEG